MPQTVPNRTLSASAAIVLLLAGSLYGITALADEPAAPQPRPKVCLVLSGGGARGAAHLGVIKALEKLRIPVDCIAGTSMGAIIGGLYATGMTADDLEAQMNRRAIQDDMADITPRSRMTYTEKQDQIKYLLRLEFGYADGHYIFPQGIVNGDAPGRILNVLTLAQEPDTDFNKLPIPFRAVAADIETGDMVVLDHGSLTDAIRASLSIPGLYPPVRIDGHLLVDGGLSRNLPVDVARAMGADVVIAVNIRTPLAKGDQLTDVISVSLQVVKLYNIQNVKDSIATLTSRDVLIEPDLGDIGPTDFTRMGEAIEAGEQQAYEQLSKLTDLQLSPEAYAAYRQQYRRMLPSPRSVDFVDVNGNGDISPNLIRARFGVQPGSPWSMEAINDGLRNLYDLGYFQRVDAALVHRNGATGIDLMVQPKEWQPSYLQFGLHISDDFEGDSNYELLGGYTATEIDSLGAEWRNQFEIGKTRLFYTELFQPLDYNDTVFIAPNAEYLNETFDLFSGQNRVAEYGTVFPHGGVDLGWRMGDAGETRLGLLYGHVVSQPRIGDPTLYPTYRSTLLGTHFSVGVDTFDNGSFPSHGSYALITGFFPRTSLGGDASYDKLDATVGHAFDVGGDPMLFLVEGGSNLGTPLPVYEQFQLGGFLSLAGKRQGQLRGDRVFDAHLVYAHHAADLITGLGGGLYLGGGLDVGNVWGNTRTKTVGMQYGLMGFVGADTVLGPLYFGVGGGKSGSLVFFLYLGIPINGTTLAPSFGN
ncbi:MAG TPA: patatin-like phospholipase family protein [Gammaproteobacteria bacterium]|nr:patatin-like phospholipase family protein [Gammaproteobacteria bacterium]